MTPAQHAEALADAIQRFRNLPMLVRMMKLRRTPEFAGLCEAWEAWIEEYGTALDTLAEEEIAEAAKRARPRPSRARGSGA